MSGSDNPLHLAELISARISHDLSGLVGTLANALELAVEEAAAPSEAVTLAADAASEVRLRLRLLRFAWGPVASAISLPELSGLAEGLPAGRRVALVLAGLPADTVLPPHIARVVVNVLMLAAESLPGGGEVVLAGSADDLIISIAGPRAAWPAGLAACLNSEAAAWAALRDPRHLQMPFTAVLARALGLRLSLVLGPGILKLRLNESSG